MSEFTKVWTQEKIRMILRNLDKKTGLNGGELPIKLVGNMRHYGLYYPDTPAFSFNMSYFNSPQTKESEVINTIRHEYAHHYEHSMKIGKYIISNGMHGRAFKWSCGMVGAMPVGNHYKDHYLPVAKEEAEKLYAAEDVNELNIKEFIYKWGRLPYGEKMRNEYHEYIKETSPESLFSAGDEVFCRYWGFCRVLEYYPFLPEPMVRILPEKKGSVSMSVPATRVTKVEHGMIDLTRKAKKLKYDDLTAPILPVYATDEAKEFVFKNK